ncbi:MAG: FG-GAP repeat protein [Phycisphaerae bacterium]
MSSPTLTPCNLTVVFAWLLIGAAWPALAREETAVLIPGGSAVDMSGNHIVVGDPEASVDFINHAGKVYIYEGDGANRALSATLTAPVPGEYDWFGAAVAIDGDLLVVGAPADDFQLHHEGAAYIFRKTGETWVNEASLDSGIPNPWDMFGLSVAAQADRVAIGNPFSSSVNVYRYETGSWALEAELMGSDFGVVGSFGFSVSFSGDRLVVGHPLDNHTGSDSGSAYVFRRAGTVWTEEAKLTASDASPVDRFGHDVDMDGTRIVIGTPQRDGEHAPVGGAYVFEWSGSLWEQTHVLGYPEYPVGGAAGSSVAMDGNWIILGAPYYPIGAGEGVGFLFCRAGAGMECQMLDLLVPSDPAVRKLGHASAVEGSVSALIQLHTGSGMLLYDLGGDIPTVSEWGMVALTLSVLIVGTALLRDCESCRLSRRMRRSTRSRGGPPTEYEAS